MKHSPARKGVTLSALFDILPPDIFLFVEHRLGPHVLEASASGTVQQLRNSRYAEVCGSNAVERIIPDDPAQGMMIVTIGGKEP